MLEASKEFVEIKSVDGIVIDLRYASANNFMNQNIYGVYNKAFLHKIAAEKLAKAIEGLRKKKSKYKLVLYDALRPRSIQKKLWEVVKGTTKEPYVANPTSGSIHNYGFAVDISIVDENDKALNMGTEFDEFSSLAQPKLEDQFLKEKKLNKQQIENRKLLRSVMEEAGFLQLPIEWWHFDALPKTEVKTNYKIVE